MAELNINYENQNKSGAAAERIFDKTLEHAEKLSGRVVGANEQVIEAKERASKANIDRFSDEKGKEQNKLYEDYLAGSVKQNFNTKVKLTEEKLALMEEITAKKLELKQLAFDTEVEQKRIVADYQIKIEALKKEYEDLKKNKKVNNFNKVFWPILGLVVGALTFVLLYIIK